MANQGRKSLATSVPLRARGLIRWTARILALLIALFAATMGIGSAVAESEEPLTVTGVGVAAFIVWIVVGMLAAWRWERIGGISGVLAGVALGFFVFFTAGRNEVLVAVMMSVPIIIVSAGFLVADRGTAGKLAPISDSEDSDG